MLAERPEHAPYPQTSRFANLFSLTSLTRARPALLPPDAACSPAPLTGHTCSPLAFLVDLLVPSHPQTPAFPTVAFSPYKLPRGPTPASGSGLSPEPPSFLSSCLPGASPPGQTQSNSGSFVHSGTHSHAVPFGYQNRNQIEQ